MAEMREHMQEARALNHRESSSAKCVTCGSPHCGERCVETFTEEEVKAMGQTRNDPYSNNYNPGWRNHPNFSWRNRDQGNINNGGQKGNYHKQYPNQNFQGQGSRQQQEQGGGSGKKSIKELLEGFMTQIGRASCRERV